MKKIKKNLAVICAASFFLHMKKIIVVLAAVLVIFGCSNDEPVKKDVTFMVYMAADNSLTEYAKLDIDEMERAVFDPASANVIVQADFNIYEENSGCRRWQIVADSLYDYQISSPEIADLGEIDTGDWQSLKSFYNWCVSEYPAERYVLSIWSHGNDWYSYSTNPNKFCPDHQNSSYYNIPDGDLHNALRGFDETPDLLIVDACHMQSVQIISEVYTECRNVCASPDLVPETGFPYAEIITKVCRTSDYSTLPEIYVDSYIPGGSQNLLGQLNQEICASIVNCSTFSDQFLPAFQDMVAYLIANPQLNSEIIDSRDQCLEFNDLDMDVDLMQFIKILKENTEDQQLIDYISDAESSFVQSSSYYNYPAYDVGNALITFPDYETIESWNNLKADYNKLIWGEITNWSQLMDIIIQENMPQ